MPAVTKNFPASEVGPGVRCRTSSGAEYLIFQSPGKRRHTLWKAAEGGYEKIASADSPVDLYDRIDWES